MAVPTLAVVLLAAAPLLDIPRPSLAGCATWIAAAVSLEAASALGFILVFKLIFGGELSRAQAAACGLRALGASVLLPGGVVTGPALGAWSRGRDRADASELTRATVAFTVITLLPGVTVVGVIGGALWLGLLPGPHEPLLTLPAAGFTAVVVTVLAVYGRSHARGDHAPETIAPGSAISRHLVPALQAAREGVPAARSVLRARDWKLLGTLAYYACDNAALWAAFHAYGATPAPTVVIMGYLVGSLASAIPVPAGLGAVEGGLIGALVLYGAPLGPSVGAVLLYRGVSLLLPVALGASAWALLPVARLRRRSRTISVTPVVPARMQARSAE